MHFEVANGGIEQDSPLIYMWEIRTQSGDLVGRYVGKAKAGASRPLKHYRRNVQNLLASKPYRKSNPNGYRRVHHALADAHRLGHTIVLSFLCKVDVAEDINEVERQCITAQNSKGKEPWQLND